MKKKIFTMLLAICFVVPFMFGLSACGENNDDNNDQTPTTPAVSYTVDETTWKNNLNGDNGYENNFKNYVGEMTTKTLNTSLDPNNENAIISNHEQTIKFDNANNVYYYHNKKYDKNNEAQNYDYDFYDTWVNGECVYYYMQNPTTETWSKAIVPNSFYAHFDSLDDAAEQVKNSDFKMLSVLANNFIEFTFEDSTKTYKGTLKQEYPSFAINKENGIEFTYVIKFENNKLVSGSVTANIETIPGYKTNISASLTNIGTTSLTLPNVPEVVNTVDDDVWQSNFSNLNNISVKIEEKTSGSNNVTPKQTVKFDNANKIFYYSEDNYTFCETWVDSACHYYTQDSVTKAWSMEVIDSSHGAYYASFDSALSTTTADYIPVLLNNFDKFKFDTNKNAYIPKEENTFKFILPSDGHPYGQIVTTGEGVPVSYELKFNNGRLVSGTVKYTVENTENIITFEDVGTTTLTLPNTKKVTEAAWQQIFNSNFENYESLEVDKYFNGNVLTYTETTTNKYDNNNSIYYFLREKEGTAPGEDTRSGPNEYYMNWEGGVCCRYTEDATTHNWTKTEVTTGGDGYHENFAAALDFDGNGPVKCLSSHFDKFTFDEATNSYKGVLRFGSGAGYEVVAENEEGFNINFVIKFENGKLVSCNLVTDFGEKTIDYTMTNIGTTTLTLPTVAA